MKKNNFLNIFILFCIISCSGGQALTDPPLPPNPSIQPGVDPGVDSLDYKPVIAGLYHAISNSSDSGSDGSFFSSVSFDLTIGANGLFVICNDNYSSFKFSDIDLTSSSSSDSNYQCFQGGYTLESASVIKDDSEETVYSVPVNMNIKNKLLEDTTCSASSGDISEVFSNIGEINFEITFNKKNNKIDDDSIGLWANSTEMWGDHFSDSDYSNYETGYYFNSDTKELVLLEQFCTGKDVYEDYAFETDMMSDMKLVLFEGDDGDRNYFWYTTLKLNKFDYLELKTHDYEDDDNSIYMDFYAGKNLSGEIDADDLEPGKTRFNIISGDYDDDAFYSDLTTWFSAIYKWGPDTTYQGILIPNAGIYTVMVLDKDLSFTPGVDEQPEAIRNFDFQVMIGRKVK